MVVANSGNSYFQTWGHGGGEFREQRFPDLGPWWWRIQGTAISRLGAMVVANSGNSDFQTWGHGGGEFREQRFPDLGPWWWRIQGTAISRLGAMVVANSGNSYFQTWGHGGGEFREQRFPDLSASIGTVILRKIVLDLFCVLITRTCLNDAFINKRWTALYKQVCFVHFHVMKNVYLCILTKQKNGSLNSKLDFLRSI